MALPAKSSGLYSGATFLAQPALDATTGLNVREDGLPRSGAYPWPRPFSPTPLSSNIQNLNTDFVGSPLAGAFSERAQTR